MYRMYRMYRMHRTVSGWLTLKRCTSSLYSPYTCGGPAPTSVITHQFEQQHMAAAQGTAAW